MSLPILGPGVLRLNLDKNPIALGDGEYQLLQNVRSSTGMCVVRMPDVAVSGGSTPGTVLRGLASISLNGTQYLVSAWVVSAATAIYIQNLSSGAFTEITNTGNGGAVPVAAGDANGKTRLATSSASVVFCVVRVPGWNGNGSTQTEPRDILVIQNGADSPLIYDPAQTGNYPLLVQHRPVTLPTNYKALSVSYSLPYCLSIRTSTLLPTAKAYDTVDAAAVKNPNVARFKLSDTSAGVYTSALANQVVLLTLTTSAASGDVAEASWSTQTKDLQGEQICIMVEGTAADIRETFSSQTFEICDQLGSYSSAFTWVKIYDPSSSDPALSTFPDLVNVDESGATDARYIIPFSTKGVSPSASRTVGMFRFVRSQVPASNKTFNILMIAAAGPDGGLRPSTEVQATWTDYVSRAESAPVVGTSQMDSVYNCGGPKLSSSDIYGIKIPRSDSLLVSATINAPEDVSTYPTGGLQGRASAINIYLRMTGETTAYYLTTYPFATGTVAGGNHKWLTNWGGYTQVGSRSLYSYAWGGAAPIRQSRDFSIPAPSDFHFTLPKVNVIGYANERCFIGNVIDPASGVQYPGDVYVSRRAHPFRFQALTEDSDSGSRVVFGGETVKAFAFTAAAFGGASKPYVWTDQSFNTLGPAGSFATDSTTLSLRQRISSDGTFEPGSIAEFQGTLYWLARDSHVKSYGGGQVQNLSFMKVGTPLAAIASSDRGKCVGLVHQQRYRLYYPSSGVLSKALVYNLLEGYWESQDTTQSLIGVARHYDSSQVGSGGRVIGYTSTATYAVDEGPGTQSISISSRSLLARMLLGKTYSDGATYSFKEFTLDADGDAAATGVAFTVTAESGSTYVYSITSYPTTAVFGVCRNLTTAPALPSNSASVNFAGTFTGGKVLRQIEGGIQPGSNEARSPLA